jgi:hypothetical protein
MLVTSDPNIWKEFLVNKSERRTQYANLPALLKSMFSHGITSASVMSVTLLQLVDPSSIMNLLSMLPNLAFLKARQ